MRNRCDIHQPAAVGTYKIRRKTEFNSFIEDKFKILVYNEYYNHNRIEYAGTSHGTGAHETNGHNEKGRRIKKYLHELSISFYSI